jgi:hypothetical protein
MLSVMTADIDIWRTAHFHLKRYGEGALLEATQRADLMASKGDLESAAVWRRVAEAILELQRTRRSGAFN